MKIIAETWGEFFELTEEYYEIPQDAPHKHYYNGLIYDSCGCIIGKYNIENSMEYKGYIIELPKFRGDTWKIIKDDKEIYNAHSTYHAKSIIDELSGNYNTHYLEHYEK